MVIIASSEDDAHAPLVTKHLRSGYIFIDQAYIAEGRTLTYRMTRGKSEVLYEGKLLKNVTGIWVRRPRRIPEDFKLPVRDRDQKYCQSALAMHFGQLYVQFPDALWLSEKFTITRAEHKTLQLQVASALGFRVPETIFTSDPKEAEKFVALHKTTIVKPISHFSPKLSEEKGYLFYATRLNSTDKLDSRGLHLAPAIFQEAVDYASDIRVTVVGEKVFATKIIDTAQSRDKLRDWRTGILSNTLKYAKYKLSKEMEAKCVALVRKLGLYFGALDLVEDNVGRLWFLEVNPNGQWAFIEDATGQPIGKAIAHLLESGNKH